MYATRGFIHTLYFTFSIIKYKGFKRKRDIKHTWFSGLDSKIKWKIKEKKNRQRGKNKRKWEEKQYNTTLSWEVYF